MPGGPEATQIGAEFGEEDFGEEDFGGALTHPWNGIQERHTLGGETPVDLGAHACNRLLQVVPVRELLAEQEGRKA